MFCLGKYDTYKGSTPFGSCIVGGRTTQGKYDTYKGSTQFNVFIFLPFSTSLGNMILIKDRHCT